MSGSGGESIDPAALTVEQAARLLSATGRDVTVEMVRAAVRAGAPIATDGRINLVELMAWLESEMAR